LWLHSLKVAQLLRSAACLHTNQSRSYLNHLVQKLQDTAAFVTDWVKLSDVVADNMPANLPGG